MDVEVEKIKRRLLVKYPFFGSVVANLNYVQNKACTTMGTDGENVFYNLEFLEKLSEDEQTFLFAHEVCHVAFEHIARSEGKDKRIWNIAADAVINAFLQKDGLPIVNGAVNMPEAVNYNVEDLYEKLIKEKRNNLLEIPIKNKNDFSPDTVRQNNNKQNGENEDGNTKISDDEESEEKIKSEELSSNYGEKKSDTNSKEITDKTDMGSIEKSNQLSQMENDIKNEVNENCSKQQENENVGHDNHSMWEDVIQRKKQEIENQENEEKGEDKIEEINAVIQENKLIDENKWGREEERNNLENSIKNISKVQEIDAFVQNSNKRKENLEEIRKALARKAIGAEKATISASRRINKIGESKSKIDWRNLLREATNLDIDWSYKNASIENGVVTPHIEDLPEPVTEILLDTSGSVSEELLRNFLRESKHILKNSRVKVGCFDTKFYGFQEIRTKEDIENMKFVGHGLTNFYTAINAFSRGTENKIIFTDGKAIIPEKFMNIIWIVFGDTKIKPNGGRVIYIN